MSGATLNFPSSPNTNDTYAFGGKTWTYNGSAWKLNSTALTTTTVTEGTNQYFTNARARAAISVAGAGSYDNTTGVITITGGVTSVGGATGAISNAQLAAGITASGVLNTSNVAEGGNLYFTTSRARNSIDAAAGGPIAYNATTGNVSLNTSGVTANTYGGASQVPVITVDTFGRITSAANVSVAGVSTFTASGNTFTIGTADGGSFSASIQPDSVTLGRDTTGAYVSNLVAGTGITISGLGNEGTTPTINNSGVLSVNGQTGNATGFATTANSLAQFASTTSAEVRTLVSDETGSGSLVFSDSPVLITPNIGTASYAVLTNATGLPVATGISGLGTGVATFLATPSSANLAAAVTDETGTGNILFSNSPVMVTPNLGTPSAATLTNATGLPISTGVSGLGTGTATFLGQEPTSANLAAYITDETGTGALVFGTSPAITTSLTTPSGSFDLVNTGATTVNFAGAGTTVNIGAATGNTNILNNMVIAGNLVVQGTTTTVSSTTLNVADKNITLAKGAADSATADGAGITIDGANATLNYVHATTAFTSSQDVDLATGKVYKVNNNQVLSATGLGPNVVASNLTSVGTITTGVWNGSEISTTYTAAKVTSVNGQVGAVTGIASTANGLSQFASTTSAELATLISDETGTGNVVFSTSPVLTTPNLGTPSTAVLTNATGLPISSGVSGLGANVATFLADPTSAKLAFAITDETGSGNVVFSNSPTLVTPALGTPSSATLTNATGLPISTGVSGLGGNVATLLSGEAKTGVIATTYGSALNIPVINVDEFGRITSAANVALVSGVSSVGGATGAVSNAQLASAVTSSGVLTTANVAELTNLYFSNSRAILAEIPAVTQLAVTNSGMNFLLDSYSGNNPTIYVTAGETISFDLNVTGHPFMIRVSSGGSNYDTGLTHVATDGTVTTGSSAQGKVTGKLFWKVPYSLNGSTYVYQCSVHAGMVGNIVIQKPVSTITTADVAELTNLYFTNARSRQSITAGTGITYDTANGIISASGTYTDANARAALSITGTKGQYNNSTGVFNFTNIANVTVSANAPGSPNIGDQWIDEDDGTTYLYFDDGTSSQWVEQATGIIVSALVESVGGSTGAISNVMLATALTGQNITVGNLIPSGNLIQSLGSPTNQFKDLYLAGNTIHLGGLQLTNNAGGLSVVTPSGSGAGDLTAGNVTVNGNLIVLGSTTTVSSTTLEVADKNITIAKGAANSTAADGAGITVDGASATFNYVHATTAWTSSQDINLASGKVLKINGTTAVGASGVTANTYGGAAKVPVFTVDTFGRITSAANVNVAGVSTFAASGNTFTIGTADGGTFSASIQPDSVVLGRDTTGNYLSNVVPGTGLTGTNFGTEDATPTISLAISGVTANTYGGAAKVPVFTVDTFGRITSAANVNVAGVSTFAASGNTFTIGTADGGTFNASIQPNSVRLDTDITGFGTGVATFLGQEPTSANLRTLITDETGTGVLVFGTSPAITTSLTTPSASFDLINTTATTVNFAKAATTLSVGAATGSTTVNHDMIITGNLQVTGTTTTVSSATLSTADKIITVASGSTNSAAANGAGIAVAGANATYLYNSTSNAWTSSQDIDLASGKVFKINGTTVAGASGVTANTYGGAAKVPVFTVDTFGRITSAANVNVAGVSTFSASGNTFTIGTADGGTFNASIQPNSVRLGTDTTGDYVTSMTAGSGITVGTATGEGSTPVITNTGVISVNGSSGAVTGIATTAGTLAQFGATTSSQLAGVISDETGSGALVFANSPTLVTPALGTPSAIVLTSGTGLPLSSGVTGTLPVANGGTGTSSPATVAGTAISVSGSFPNQTITNTGVTSLVAGTNISVSGGTGAVTVSVSGTVAAATNATNTAITNDTSTNASFFPTFVSSTSGNLPQTISNTKLFFNPSTGLLTSTDYNSSSDKRLKKNIMTVTGALDAVDALRGVTFTWKDSNTSAIGMIAQEVKEVLPEVVTTDDDGYMGIKYTNVIGVLVEAIKELKADFEAYKKTHP